MQLLHVWLPAQLPQPGPTHTKVVCEPASIGTQKLVASVGPGSARARPIRRLANKHRLTHHHMQGHACMQPTKHNLSACRPVDAGQPNTGDCMRWVWLWLAWFLPPARLRGMHPTKHTQYEPDKKFDTEQNRTWIFLAPIDP